MRRGLSLAAVAMDRKVIDGATEEMNSIASQNLDHASARRRVHQAFSVAQQNLDHLLLKVCVCVCKCVLEIPFFGRVV